MKKIITSTFILLSVCSFGQTMQDKIPDLYNWFMHTTKITVDSSCILNKKISFNGQTYNYYKIHVALDSVKEYGNIDKYGQADGKWYYQNKYGKPGLTGNTIKGYKIGKWVDENCICNNDKCFYVYKWTKDKKRTHLFKMQTCE